MKYLSKNIYAEIVKGEKLLAILIDPEKFSIQHTQNFLVSLPKSTTHLLVGGSTGGNGVTTTVVTSLKKYTKLPIVLFPGNYEQLVPQADAILFLNLLSGRNPEYLINQQVKAVPFLKRFPLEVIPTGYILIDGGVDTAVAKVSGTKPLSQEDVDVVLNTALAGQFMGASCIYLEAGSGAKIPVSRDIISAVKSEISIPLIVGGGIKTEAQKQSAYEAGADMVVMGTAFEK